MKVRSTICRTIGLLLLGLGGVPGCGAPVSDTGPTEQPNIGPGFPAGSPSFAAKIEGKANTSASAGFRETTKK